LGKRNLTKNDPEKKRVRSSYSRADRENHEGVTVTTQLDSRIQKGEGNKTRVGKKKHPPIRDNDGSVRKTIGEILDMGETDHIPTEKKKRKTITGRVNQ